MSRTVDDGCKSQKRKSLPSQVSISASDITIMRTGQPWIEFHVDYWSRCVQNTSNDEETLAPNKEATMSIRVSPRAKPLMIIVQDDESVFAQYLLGSKTWVGPKGQ